MTGTTLLLIALVAPQQAPPPPPAPAASPASRAPGVITPVADPAGVPIAGPAAPTYAPRGAPDQRPSILEQKREDNQHMRDLYHGWSTREGMWARNQRTPVQRALRGTSDPEADFTVLAEAGVLSPGQVVEGKTMKKRHNRLLGWVRAKLASVEAAGDPARLAAARRVAVEMDRTQYMEKRAFMTRVRAVLAKSQRDLLCIGKACEGNDDTHGEPPEPLPPPPMGGL